MGMMMLRVDTEIDNPETLIQDIEDFYEKHSKNNDNTSQSTLTNNNQNPGVCSQCGTPVDQKVVNYCKVKYTGVILCRGCQGEQ